MKRSPQRLIDYLRHVEQAISRIERYVSDVDEVGFLKTELIQDAVIRNFEIIGEASKNIERDHPEFAKDHSYLPLIDAYEMRNALAHGYFNVDLEIVFKTIQNDLPALHKQIAFLVDSLTIKPPDSSAQKGIGKGEPPI